MFKFLSTFVFLVFFLFFLSSPLFSQERPERERDVDATQSKEDPSLKALIEIAETTQKEIVPTLQEFSKKMVEIQAHPETLHKRQWELAPLLSKSFEKFHKVKLLIEKAAETELSEQARETYFFTVIAYYSFLNILYNAQAILTEENTTLMVSSLSNLELVLPNFIVGFITDRQSHDATKVGLEPYDISFEFHPARKTGYKQLALNARQSSQIKLAGFYAFPRKEKVPSLLRFSAMRVLFERQALLNSYLYAHEKVDFTIKQYADPVYLSTQDRANSLFDEKSFRTYLTGAVLRPLYESLVNENKDFRNNLEKLFSFAIKLSGNSLDCVGFASCKSSGALNPKEAVEKYLELEKKRLPDVMAKIIQSSSLYLTKLSHEELKAVLFQIAYISKLEYLKIYVLQHFFNPDDLSEFVIGLVSLSAASVVNASFKDKKIPDEIISTIKDIKKNKDLLVSLKRYQLADELFLASEFLIKTEEALKQVVDRDNLHEKAVPMHLIPNEPDVGAFLVAWKKDDPDASPSAMEFIQSVGSLISKATTAKEIRALQEVLFLTHPKILSEIKKIALLTKGKGLSEIRKAHQEKKDIPNYKWSGLALKVSALKELVKTPQAQRILDSFNNIHTLLEQTHSITLLEGFKKEFSLLTENSKKGMAYFENLVAKDLSFIQSEQTTLKKLFQPQDARNAYLRSELTKVALFSSYLTVYIQELAVQYPVLFLPITLPKALFKNKDLPEKIRFLDLVKGFKKTIERTTVGNAFIEDSIQNLQANALNAEVKTPLSPLDFLNSAAVEIKAASEASETGYLKKFVEWSADKIWGLEQKEFSQELHWQKKFYGRDILPVLTDSSADSLKTLKVLISVFLGPYIKNAAHATLLEQNQIFDVSKDLKKVLAESEAMKIAIAEVGEQSSELLTEYKDEMLKSQKRLQSFKQWTMRFQQLAHYVFTWSMYGGPLVPMLGHIWGGRYMFGASILDYFVDVALLHDYTATYNRWLPFAQAGALGKGLISYKDLDSVREQMTSTAKVLIDRTPLDLIFYGSIIKNMAMAGKQKRVQKVVGAHLKRLNTAFMQEISQVGGVLETLGLPGVVHPMLFNALYRQKAEQLSPKVLQRVRNEVEETEFRNWVKAKKEYEKVMRKYASLFKDVEKLQYDLMKEAFGGNLPASHAQSPSAGEKSSEHGK